MCRNIKPLFNFTPPATESEIMDASLQFVRKLTGMQKPSRVNAEAFNSATAEITKITQTLFATLQTSSPQKDRVGEAEKRKVRSLKRFG